jgi:hypothetical protein
VEVGLDHRFEAGGGRNRALADGALPQRRIFLRDVFQRRDQELILGFEIKVDDARRESGFARDVRQSQAGIAVAPDRAHGRVDQLLAPNLLGGFRFGHLDSPHSTSPNLALQARTLHATR